MVPVVSCLLGGVQGRGGGEFEKRMSYGGV